jgi:hypothetical protein
MKIRRGSRRIVFVFKDYVIKIPNFINGWVSFIAGIRENLEERYWWNPNHKWEQTTLAEIFWADRFGFIVKMERLDTTLTADIEYRPKEDYKLLSDLYILKERWKSHSFVDDINLSNVGYRKDKLVIFDYGFFGGNADYILSEKKYLKTRKEITNV